MRALIRNSLCLALASVMLVGCSSGGPVTESDKDQLHDEVQATLNDFTRRDPSLQERIDNAAGYVVFPNIAKGGLIIGGAVGWGEVYEQGELVGYAKMTQGTIGLQGGGQTVREIILFKTQSRLNEFKAGNFNFSAEASAVAAKSGAAAQANYKNDVLVFTRSQGGLMAEASVGGQQFKFVPQSEEPMMDSDQDN